MRGTMRMMMSRVDNKLLLAAVMQLALLAVGSSSLAQFRKGFAKEINSRE